MYFVPPARSHTTMTSVGRSVPVPWRFSGFVQSRAANCAFISALTPNAGVAAASAVVGIPDPEARTCRNRSSAVCPTNSTTRRPVSPGTEITI